MRSVAATVAVVQSQHTSGVGAVSTPEHVDEELAVIV
jgi:hypothetical protein